MKAVSLLLLLASSVVAQEICFVPPTAQEDGSLSYTRQICLNATALNIDGAFTVIDLEEDAEPTLSVYSDLDTIWVLVAGVLVFWMQAGFGMLEAGAVSHKNVNNILFKNFCDVAIAAIVFYLVGYAFAYGEGGSFIGGSNFALSKEDGSDWHSWFFQFAFAATAATIVSGSVAERCRIHAYFVYSFCMTFFIYPVVVHWVWAGDGWLSAFGEDGGNIGQNGLIDFAGSGVVHMVGGFAGLVGALMLGPRKDRFSFGHGSVMAKPAHSSVLQALGTFILWMGWYGFNAGSTLAASGGASNLAGKVAITTTLCPAAAALTCVALNFMMTKQYDLGVVFNGILGGLVSITAGCATIEPGLSIVVGIIGGFVYYGTSKLLLRLKIDDPLDAFPVHGMCGVWGLLAVGIFSTQESVSNAYGYDNDAIASGQQFGIQLAGAAAIAGWTLTTSLIMFIVIKHTIKLRVDASTEERGLDLAEHGAKAYNMDEFATSGGGGYESHAKKKQPQTQEESERQNSAMRGVDAEVQPKDDDDSDHSDSEEESTHTNA